MKSLIPLFYFIDINLLFSNQSEKHPHPLAACDKRLRFVILSFDTIRKRKEKKISIFRASLFRLKYFYFFLFFFLFCSLSLSLSIFLFLCDKHLCTAVTQIHKIVEVNYLSKPALVRRLKIENWFLYGSKPSRHGKTKTI